MALALGPKSIPQRRLNPFKVGTEGYAGLNPTHERPFADAIDKTGLTWARNPSRSGYGIPLISVGPTSNFYPDFLIWTDERVICVDTKGPHMVHETARRKLLRIRPAKEGSRLDVQFVSNGKYDDHLEQKHSSGFTCWGLRDDGTLQAVHYADLEHVVKYLVQDSLHAS